MATSGWGRIKKPFFRKSLDDGVRHLLGRQCGGAQHVRHRGRGIVQHARVNALRTEAGNAQSLPVIGDREPLGKRDGSVLGNRVGCGANLGQQSRGGGGLQQVAAALAPPFAGSRRGRHTRARES